MVTLGSLRHEASDPRPQQSSKHVFIFMLEFLFYSVPWSVYSFRASNQPKKTPEELQYVQHNMTSFENLVSLKGGRWNNLGQHLFRLKKDKMTEKNSLKRRFPLNIKMTYTKWTNICMCCNATTLSSSIQVQDRKRKQQRNALISPITSVH
jgi:hypothetical protein